MRARRTHRSDRVWYLDGGTEDNDLWTETLAAPDGSTIISSTWVLDDDERARIAAGENIELLVWGAQPPVTVRLTDAPIGKAPNAPEVP